MRRRRDSARNKPSSRDTRGVELNLVNEARNARRRLRALMDSEDSELYYIPNPGEYTTEKLRNRLEAGEKVETIVDELRGLTSSNIKSGATVTNLGYRLSNEEKKALRSAISKANRNITFARRKFNDIQDVFPETFNYTDFIQNISGPDAVKYKIEDLGVFTKDKLVPIAVNEIGEAGTQAEKEYYIRIIERENERRANQFKDFDPTQPNTFLRVTADFGKKPIQITGETTRDQLKKRAKTWDDPARIYRSNLFLTNYIKALDNFEAVLRHNGMINSTIQMRIDYIREVIPRFYNNEEAIFNLSNTIPGIDIGLMYDSFGTELNFTAIYDAWTLAEDTYL